MNFIQTFDYLVVLDDGVHMPGVMDAMKGVKAAVDWSIGDGGSDRRAPSFWAGSHLSWDPDTGNPDAICQ